MRRTASTEVAEQGYSTWLADFRRRLQLHDRGVEALARDLAARTSWRVEASGEGFGTPAEAAGRPPDVLCHRGGLRPPLCLEVELPETLVRRETVRRLRALRDGARYDTRLVLIAAADQHERRILEGRRLLARAGIDVPVAALAPEEDTITGADW